MYLYVKRNTWKLALHFNKRTPLFEKGHFDDPQGNLEVGSLLIGIPGNNPYLQHEENSKYCLEMVPFYEHVCNELKWSVDNARLRQMKEENTKELEELDSKIKTLKKILGN